MLHSNIWLMVDGLGLVEGVGKVPPLRLTLDLPIQSTLHKKSWEKENNHEAWCSSAQLHWRVSSPRWTPSTNAPSSSFSSHSLFLPPLPVKGFREFSKIRRKKERERERGGGWKEEERIQKKMWIILGKFRKRIEELWNNPEFSFFFFSLWKLFLRNYNKRKKGHEESWKIRRKENIDLHFHEEK